jgi:hypothetical protein
MSTQMTVGDLISDLSVLDKNEKVYIDADLKGMYCAVRVEIGYDTGAKKSMVILQAVEAKRDTQTSGGR